MNYKIPKISKDKLVKAVKCLSVAGVLFLGLSTIFYPKQSLSTLPACTATASPSPGVNCLPDCSTLAAATAANPGTNCLYFNLPPCSGFVGTAQPRINCADLIDLPLCGQIDGTPNEKKNCVKECSPTGNATTSDHNSVCVRFCDKMPSTLTATPGANCVYRKCHQTSNGTSYQLADGTTPAATAAVTPAIATITNSTPITATNCSLQQCNLLTPDELNETRLQDDTKGLFCSSRYNTTYDSNSAGADIKCYSFVAAQLPYTRYRLNNTMCQIHSCKPPSASCGADDTLNISNNTTSLTLGSTSSTYSALYINYVNIGLPLTDTSVCQTAVCKPIIYTPYTCSGEPATTRDPSCDSSGEGSICATTACAPGQTCHKDLGQCYKTTDCNLAANANLSMCKSIYSGDLPDSNPADDTNSWFYRPKPMNKAFKGDNPTYSTPTAANKYNYRVSGMCYSQEKMADQGWGWLSPRIDLILFVIPSFYSHSYISPDRTRSPENCGAGHDGSRGNGYAYLCGNGGNLYNKVSDHTAYYKGYTSTVFSDNKEGVSNIEVCLRFKNAMRPDDIMSNSETCGRRECGVSCAFDVCGHQACGYDVCKTLTVKDSNSKECVMTDGIFDDTADKDCMETIDTYLRLRAVKYGHKVCTFLDVKGQLAYNPMFLDGNQKLDDGTTCISGSYNSATGNCEGGKSSNDVPGQATKWRAILKIPYTQDNVGGTRPGFWLKSPLQNNNSFVDAQECAQVPLRVGPPPLPNLAVAGNALKLFTPPLFIRDSNIARYCPNTSTTACSSSPDMTASSLGTTDFLYPSITVQFGTTTRVLSLGKGHTGYETSQDAMSYAMDPTPISTISNNVTYTANLIIKKEFNNDKPVVCLYHRVTDGSSNNDIRLNCVDRTLPDINNGSSSVVGLRKIEVTSNTSTSNVYNPLTRAYGDTSITLKYCDNAGCTGSNGLTLINTNPDSPTCDGVNQDNMEKYKVCAQREPCSKLYKECFENEINIQNYGTNSTYEATRASCATLSETCNTKKGIASDSGLSLIDQVGSSTGADSNAYGWFNELCFVSGFETKLKRVYNHVTTSGVMGKCKLTAASAATSACVSGGGNPKLDCYCEEYGAAGDGINYDAESRTQTPREAGLCIDMPTPQTCPAVNYYGDTYTNSSLDVAGSANKTTYNDSTGVHSSHQNRTNSIITGAATGGGHGEFPTSVVGMNNVAGSCYGFWQKNSVSGTQVAPKMSCSLVSGNGAWGGVPTTVDTTSAPCIRYSCPAVATGSTTAGNSNNDGSYPNLGISSYALPTETADSVSGTNPLTYTSGTYGASNGYATWTQYTKTSDFAQLGSGTCITGFKNNDSAPTRDCNQKGSWKAAISNSCIRITCPAVIPTFSPSVDWAAWAASKGASFAVSTNSSGVPTGSGWTTIASRSTTAVTPGSTVNGVCNTSLGFFQIVGGAAPQRDCLSNGTWSAVRNPCVSSCNAVTTPGSNDGNASWNRVDNVDIGGETPADGICISGYKPYPYSPLRNDHGQGVSNANINNPVDTTPKRTCQSVSVVGGNANVWTATSSSCINRCPGASDGGVTGAPVDTRVGVGKTQHSTATYGTITIDWPSAAGNSWTTKTIGTNSGGVAQGTTDLTGQNASGYTQNRTNGHFVVSRYCNSSTYRWDSPVIQCATNSGEISGSNALYAGTSSPGNTSETTVARMPLNANSTIDGTCKSGYTLNSAAPQYKCQADSSGNIDKYYYASSGGNPCAPVTCSATAGQDFGSGSINNTATTRTVGQELILSCKNGYGKALTPSYRTISNGETGICDVNSGAYLNDTDRQSSFPKVTCLNTGSWSSATDDCSACRGCNSSDGTKFVGTLLSIGDARNGAGCGNNDCYYISAVKTTADCNAACATYSQIALSSCDSGDRCINDKAHLGTQQWCQSQHHGDDSSAAFGFKCFDGRFYVKNTSSDTTNAGDNDAFWGSTKCSNVGF